MYNRYTVHAHVEFSIVFKEAFFQKSHEGSSEVLKLMQDSKKSYFLNLNPTTGEQQTKTDITSMSMEVFFKSRWRYSSKASFSLQNP